ncbi:MAG TPA: hypothetical protein GX731_07505 [Clostridiales bacterium]|nr:hypothetical protein [Clostridiales bacterium]
MAYAGASRVRVLNQDVVRDITRLKSLKRQLTTIEGRISRYSFSGDQSFQIAIKNLKNQELSGQRYDKYCRSVDTWISKAKKQQNEMNKYQSELYRITIQIERKLQTLEANKYTYEWRGVR